MRKMRYKISTNVRRSHSLSSLRRESRPSDTRTSAKIHHIACCLGVVVMSPQATGELPQDMACTVYISLTSMAASREPYPPWALQAPVISDWPTRHNWSISKTPILSNDLEADHLSTEPRWDTEGLCHRNGSSLPQYSSWVFRVRSPKAWKTLRTIWPMFIHS